MLFFCRAINRKRIKISRSLANLVPTCMMCCGKSGTEGGENPSLGVLQAGWCYGVTMLNTFDHADAPPELVARTRKK
jgi:hypothetical protein